MKILILFYIFFIFFYSCSKKTLLSEDYILSGKSISEYKNEYNLKKQLLKIHEKSVIESYVPNSSGKVTDFSESLYFYDGRDSLMKIEYYLFNEKNIKTLLSVSLFSDSTLQHVHFNEYPNDTMMYSFELFRNINNEKKIVEKYKKEKLMNPLNDEIQFSEEKVIYSYFNNENEIIVSKMTKGFTNNLHFEFITTERENRNKDTIITKANDERNNILYEKKEYKSGQFILEVNKDFEMGSIDSTFYLHNNVVKDIRLFNTEKWFSTFQYDKYNNIIKREDYKYKKIF